MLVLALFVGASATAADSQEPSQSAGSDDPVTVAEAVQELEEQLQQEPDNPKLHMLLGLAYMRQDDDDRALDAFRRAVALAPESAEAHNWLGVALISRSDLPGGIAELRRAIELDPANARAYSNLGSALVTSGDMAEAVEAFRKALELEPDRAAARLSLGMALRESGDLDHALEHLRRVAEAEPDHADVHYQLGQTLQQQGDLPGAIAAFERAVELQPEMREGYFALGAALKRQGASAGTPPASPAGPADASYRRAQEAAARGDLAAAKDGLIEALRLDESHADAHSLLGFALGQLGDLDTALVHLERAVALRPASAEARYHLGVALWYRGSRDRALAELRESIAADPAAGGSHAFLGMALREIGDRAGARASLQRAIALLPPTAAVYVDLGIVFLQDGALDRALGQFHAGLNAPAPWVPTPDWEAAIAALRKTIPAHSDHAEAHNVLGLLLGRRGAAGDEVAAAFREAIRLEPKHAEAHNHLGLVLIQTGDTEGGIAALREAVGLAPGYADARANLGAALTPTDVDGAIRELEEAVALAPGYVNAHFNLAVAYGTSPRHGPAKEIEQLRKVIDLAPAFARAHLALGKALLGDGQVPGALDALQEAVRLDPENGEGHYQLGLALARAGRRDEAAATLERGRALVSADDRLQNANLDVAEGRVALERGDVQGAVSKFRHAIQLVPDSSDAQQHLGAALERLGDVDGATQAYRKALELNPAAVAAREALQRLGSAKAGVDDPARMAELEAYFREQRFAEVEPLLAAYVEERPTSSWGWYALGYSAFAQQKIGDSIKALAKSLQLDVTNAEAHKILGRNLMVIGRFEAAQLEFELGIRYNPRSAEMHYNLGKLFSIQDNWEPARKAFEAALRIDPEYVEALDGLGLALESLGDDAGALAQYEKAVAVNDARGGRFSSALVNLSAYYNRTDDPERAITYARRALKIDPDSDGAWFQRGRAHERQGQLDDAVSALNQAISTNPRVSSYYYVLAGVYRRLGWMDESRKALDVFERLERESNELEKKRRGAAGSAEAAPPGRPRE